MTFLETTYSSGKKQERRLEFSDNKEAVAYADQIFLKNSDAASMHANWTGAEVKVYMIASKRTANRIHAGKLFYTLEPVDDNVVRQQST